MNKNQSNKNFTDEQLNDIQLPDEDKAWQHMQQLLDKDDNGRRKFPPLFLRTCAGWGLTILLLLTATWFVLKPHEWWSDEKISEANETTQSKKKIEQQKNEDKTNFIENNSSSGVNTFKNKDQDLQQNISSKAQIESLENKIFSVKKNRTAVNDKKFAEKKVIANTTSATRQLTSNESNIRKVNKPINTFETNDQNNNNISDGITTDTATRKYTNPQTLKEATVATENKIDTLKNSPESEVETISIKEKENKSSQTNFYITAGVGVQQQIPFNGQVTGDYSYGGSRISISDYIPSVYVRLHHKKWFLQGEFRYGAPQSIPDLSYNRQTNLDSSNSHLTTTSLRLKKTYYHQLPLSINYNINTHWSIGAGGIYSRFYRAVTEQEIKTRNIQTDLENVTKKIIRIPAFNDSFLYKSQLHLMLQTDYQWKKFSFGLRYTKDVQPYIKYTKPDGEIKEEKNQTLQLIIRYRLFGTKKD